MLNVFKMDEEFLQNEKNYETIKKEILGMCCLFFCVVFKVPFFL